MYSLERGRFGFGCVSTTAIQGLSIWEDLGGSTRDEVDSRFDC
jgi:hypothetical protein